MGTPFCSISVGANINPAQVISKMDQVNARALFRIPIVPAAMTPTINISVQHEKATWLEYFQAVTPKTDRLHSKI